MAAPVSMDVSDLTRLGSEQALDHGLGRVVSRALQQPLHRLTIDLRRARKMRVIVLFGACYEEFQVKLREQLYHQLELAQLYWTPLNPELDFVWEEHLDLWARLVGCRQEYDAAIVVVPSWGPESGARLAGLAARFAKPIVFVDQNPDGRQKHPKNVTHVGVSELAGGRMQGEAAIKLNGTKPIKKILVLTGPTKPDRLRGIQEMVAWHLPGCVVDVSGEGAYHRETAANIILERVLASWKPGRRPVDLVITTSDSMAYGGMDVHRELASRGYEPPMLITYDGLKMARESVASGDINYTFVQDPAAMAAAAVDQVGVRLYGQEQHRGNVLVPGYLLGPQGRVVSPQDARRSKSAERVEVLAGLIKAATDAVRINESKALIDRYLALINARLARFQ